MSFTKITRKRTVDKICLYFIEIPEGKKAIVMNPRAGSIKQSNHAIFTEMKKGFADKVINKSYRIFFLYLGLKMI